MGRSPHYFIEGILNKPCKNCGCQITEQNATYLKQSVRGICKDCLKKESQKYHRNHRLNRQIRGRNDSLRLKFNITVELYQSMLIKQNGVCAICGNINPDGRALAVDHCHKTGKIRALLCLRCNTTLGQFDEDKNLLMKLIDYLIKHEENISE